MYRYKGLTLTLGPITWSAEHLFLFRIQSYFLGINIESYNYTEILILIVSSIWPELSI